jgi:HAL2 family 3'(2'),5'-bisphosphate nucleotidase
VCIDIHTHVFIHVQANIRDRAPVAVLALPTVSVVCMTTGELRAAAVSAVREACSVTELVRAQLCQSDTMQKADSSPVTCADFAAQAILILLLKRQFPGIPFVAEEDAHELRAPSGKALAQSIVAWVRRCSQLEAVTDDDVLRAIDSGGFEPGSLTSDDDGRLFWCIDPIDGTKGFLRNDQYAVCLGLVRCETNHLGAVSGKPVLGVLGCPRLPSSLPATGEERLEPRGVVLHAASGQGVVSSSWRPARAGVAEGDVSVDARSRLAPNCFVESVEAHSTDQTVSVQVATMVGLAPAPLRLDSQAKYAAVARGDAAAYLRLAGYRHNIWDHAAGACIVAESGGRVTDAVGAPLNFAAGRTLSDNRGGIVATAACTADGALHDAVVRAIAAAAGA